MNRCGSGDIAFITQQLLRPFIGYALDVPWEFPLDIPWVFERDTSKVYDTISYLINIYSMI